MLWDNNKIKPMYERMGMEKHVLKKKAILKQQNLLELKKLKPIE